MNILVCVKQVPDDFVKVHLDTATGQPATADIDKVVNAFDTYAVEMAVRYCEANGGKVVVATIGEENAVRPALVQMIAVGAHQGYIALPSAAAADESLTATDLAELVKKCEEAEGAAFDVILCGKESTDEISSQVGAMLAEKMKVGFVSSVVGMTAADNGMRVQQETEDGFAYYETSCPAVFSVAKPAYDPRYPNLKSKMAARKAVIPCIEVSPPHMRSAESSGGLSGDVPAVTCLSYTEPPKREAGVKIQEKDALEAVKKAIDLMSNDKVL